MIETRQRLVEATRECVGRKGLAATTSRDIAAAAGANLSAITYYFGSKEELVAASLLENVREWLMPAIDVLTGDGEPAERMMAAIQALTTTFESHRPEVPAYLEGLLQAPRLESLQRGLLHLWHDLGRLLAAQMKAMQADGLLPGWVDPEAMASLLIAVANGLVLQVTIDSAGPDLSAMAAQFATLLLAGRS